MKRRVERAGWLAAFGAQLTAHLTVLSLPCSAQDAARPQTRFSYQRERGAETCPDETQLRDAVSGRLGYVPFDDTATMRVDVQIRRQGRKLMAEVVVDPGDGSGSRSRALSSAARNCDELADGLSLAVSIAIDPLSLTRPNEPAPAPVEAAKPDPTPEPVPAAPPAAQVQAPPPAAGPAAPPASPEGPTTGLRFGADVLGSLGAVPGPSAGLTVFGGLTFGHTSLALELRGDFPRAEQSGQQEVSALRAAVQLVPCAELDFLFGCGVVSTGLLMAEGKGDGGKSDELAFVAGVGARVGAHVELRRQLFFRGYLEGVGAPTKVALFRADREIWRTPALNGSLAIGLFGAWP